MNKKCKSELQSNQLLYNVNGFSIYSLLLIIFLFASGTTYGQVKHSVEKTTVTSLGIEEGLSDNGITQIIQDKDDYIWLATGHGLNRTDGLNIKSYHHNLHQVDSISDNVIKSVFQDQQGAIWIGTIKGLNRLNNQQSGFLKYFHDQSAENSLSDDNITVINQDRAGHLWIGTNNGINLWLNDSQNPFKRYLFNGVGSGAEIGAELESAVSVNFIQPIGTSILVGTNKGLYQYDAKTDQFSVVELGIAGIPNSTNFTTSFIDSANTIWLSIGSAGVYYKKADQQSFTKLADTTSFVIVAINEDENNNIWLGSKKNGLFIYYPNESRLAELQLHSNSKTTDLSSVRVQYIMRDKSGLMWIGTSRFGLIQWHPKSRFIKHFGQADLMSQNSVYAAMIWTFREDSKQRLWIATAEGVKMLDPATDQILSISIKTASEEKEPEVYSISLEGSDLWFTTDKGLIRYTPEIGVTKRITANSNNPINLPEGHAVYASEFLDGILYLAIQEYGLLAVNQQSNTLKKIELRGKGENAISSNNPITLKIAADKSLWILTTAGLFNYQPEQDRIRFAIGEGPDQLSNAYISAFYQQSANSFWIGTSGNGINFLTITDYQKGTYKIQQLNHLNELNYRIINGLLLDDAEPPNLWITTHSGLFYYNQRTESVRQFSATNGIQAKEFNEGAYYKDREGKLYIGGVNGFNRIDPLGFTSSKYQPAVRITDISIQCSTPEYSCKNVKNLKLSDYICEGKACSEKNLPRLELPNNLEKLEFSFVALDFTQPEMNKYRYRLYSDKNSDKLIPWIALNNEHSLLFTKLKSNDYILEIQGTNHAGYWSENTARINFNIDSVWYVKNYSFFFLGLILLLTIYLFIMNRRIKLRESEKVKLAINKIEENFKFALWGSGDELWEWTIATDELIRTNPMKSIELSTEQKSNKLKDIVELIHPDDVVETQKAFMHHIKGKSTHFESFFRVEKQSGGYLWVLTRGRVVERNENGKALRLLGSIKDVTLIKSTEDKLTLVAKAFENTMDGISILDPNFRAVFNNQAFYKITCLSSSEAINKQYFFSEQSNNHDKYQQIKIALRNFGEWEGEIWETRNNGEKFAIELKIDSVLDSYRNISNYICIFSDITHRKKSEAELRKLANFDSLTGLPNRSLFMDRLTQAVAFAKRNQSKFALLFIDLDHFKNINDSLGHTVGDELLRKVSQRLGRCVRDVDTIARLGGDEFVIILECVHNADEVGVCADKIINRMLKSFDVSGSILKISPSIGIGLFPSDGNDIETLLKNADLAMYSAKEKGRNNYQFFTSDMTSSAIERINIENKLREAIEKNQLELYYQPKVYSVTGELTGFEALIRWIHPEEGMISPAAFIPIAEETGLILTMGDWILEQAISQAKAWSRINDQCCTIAINLSARQFQQENLSDTIAKLLLKYDLPAKYIELEITEGTLMSNMDHAISSLENLRSMGISLALDDFGTGYSSLSYLKRFPVNKLKVDQSFVRDITTDPGDASIVASIISLAHNLGLNVVAEGCETLDQLRFICSYHCEEVQGYLFSRPLPHLAAEEILKDGHILIDRD